MMPEMIVQAWLVITGRTGGMVMVLLNAFFPGGIVRVSSAARLRSKKRVYCLFQVTIPKTRTIAPIRAKGSRAGWVGL
jgi:hypothetical protein